MPKQNNASCLELGANHIADSSFVSKIRWILLSCLLAVTTNPLPARAQNESATSLDSARRTAIVNKVAEVMRQAYIYEDLGTRMGEYLMTQSNDGVYDDIVDLRMFGQQLTKDLITVSQDKHIRITPTRRNNGTASTPAPEVERRRKEEMERRNYGFHKLEMMPGQIGYLDMRSFSDPTEAGPTVTASMRFLANSKALIFDLRNNGGGFASMVQLLSSYLYDEPVHLTTHLTRIENSSKEIWTHHVEGPRFGDVPVFILTSGDSFSAAEGFAYHLQALGRATIVGETSAGGAHPIRFIDAPEVGVTIKTPISRNINPVTGTDWERVGVVPNIKVTAEKALETACVAAFDSLLKVETDKGRQDTIRFHQVRYRGWANPIVLDQSALEEYVGTYECDGSTTRIELDNGRLVAVLPGGTTRWNMTPLEHDIFEMSDEFNLEIIRNESGQVMQAVIVYINNQKVFRDILTRKNQPEGTP